MMKTIKVDGKVYQKTARFGNWKAKTVFRNKKQYDRNKFKQQDID